ncbi:putative oxidoreductase YteT precursor [compost metagenome]
MFDAPYEVQVEEKAGGHGGGDPVLLNDLFGEPDEDIYNRAADHVDGARSIMTGIAANQAIRTGLPVRISDLIKI